jgi:ABC-2 type transport system permease protein
MSAGVGTLLRYQWKLWRNHWRRDSRNRGQMLGGAIVAPIFMGALFGATLYFLNHSGLLEMLALRTNLASVQQTIAEIALEALSISSTTTFVVICLGALQQAFETFYLGPDLPLLLTSPTPRRVVFLFKLLMNMRWDAIMVLITAIPIWLAFALWLGAAPGFYLVLAVGWLCLLVLVSGLGVALAMVLVRFISVPRLRQIMLSSFLSVGLILVVAIQSLATGALNRAGIVQLLERRFLARQAWLPSVWLSRGLSAVMAGHVAEGWPWLVALALGALVALALAYAASAQLYSTGWSSAQNAEDTGKGAVPTRASKVARLERFASRAPYWALVLKDLRLFFRQPMQWYQAAVGTVAIVMVLISFAGQTRDAPSSLIIALVMSYIGASTFAMNLSLRGITREGLSWWLLQVCPLSEERILRAKFMTALIPTAIYAEAALAGMHIVLKLPWFFLFLSTPVMLAMVIGMIALDVTVGIWRADLQAVETRNADVVAVLVSQILNYVYLSPALFLMGVLILTRQSTELARVLALLFVMTIAFVPLTLLVVAQTRRYGLRALRALRLSEDIPSPFPLRLRKKSAANL